MKCKIVSFSMHEIYVWKEQESDVFIERGRQGKEDKERKMKERWLVKKARMGELSSRTGKRHKSDVYDEKDIYVCVRSQKKTRKKLKP